MKQFTFERATSPADAVEKAARTPGARFIAGGTNLLDLMKLQIESPAHLIDINAIGLDTVESTQDGGLRIGALVRNADLAAHPRVRKEYGVLSSALVSGASGQLRNRATTGGNLLINVAHQLGSSTGLGAMAALATAAQAGDSGPDAVARGVSTALQGGTLLLAMAATVALVLLASTRAPVHVASGAE